MTTGKVKWFKDDKGYGFIAGEGVGDVFVHFSQVEADDKGYKTLADWEGGWVEFELVQTEKGLHAENVRRLVGAPK